MSLFFVRFVVYILSLEKSDSKRKWRKCRADKALHRFSLVLRDDFRPFQPRFSSNRYKTINEIENVALRA